MSWYLLTILLVGLLLLAAVVRLSPQSSRGRGGRRFSGGLARRSLNSAQRQTVADKWALVESLIVVGRASSFQQAVVDADKLLDFTLKSLGASGETTGDRIRSAESRFSDYSGVWTAHKVRNRLVHEEDFQLLSHDTDRVIQQFRRALQDLGGLS